MSIELVMLSNYLILCRALLHLPSIFPSIRVFSNELALHIRWPKYWSFSISSSKEYSGLISFKIDWTSLSLTIFRSLPKFMSIASVMPSSHLILWCPLLLPSIFPSFRIFSNEFALHIRWPKYWSFHFSIGPSSEYSKLISFRMDWLDLLAVQGTLKSLLQHHSLKASILQRSAFFMVQLSHLNMTTRKTIALTMTFVSKLMSLLFNTLSRFVIAFLPRSNHLLTSWLHSPSAVISEPKKGSLSLLPHFPLLFAMKWWDWMPWS